MLASLRRACSRALGGAVLAALLMSACGGGDSGDSSSSPSSVTVAGADGASVTFDEHNVVAKTGRTVRVARNASGAPQLPSNVLPVGGIYEFTPLGLIAPGVEIRVPFNADALPSGARPLLMVAAPGEPWMQVQAARREGLVMVARVPRLTHAVVVAAPEVRRKGLFKLALGGEGDDGYSSPLQVAVASSTPTLPTPDAQMMVPVTQPTSMTLRATYDLPPECTGSRNVALMILSVEVDASGQEVGQSMSVLADAVPVSSTGELSAPFEFGVGRRGVYQVLVTAACFGDGQMTYGGVSGFVFQVDTHGAQTTGPVISAQPQNRSVVEGETVSFSVEASGGNLAYQWQRSHDGGQTYGPVTGSGATLTFAASLADHGSLWRVLVSNESGTATSVPALLTVAQRVLPPTVTSDPSNQSVLEGETASFTVVGTGTPAPTIEWQVRGAAVTDPEAGWSAIPGATGATYTTPPTTLPQSGAQYRAVLRNAGGTAASLPANLTVQQRVVAPAITSAPQPLTVQEGQLGAFAVTATGTAPLSYQWFRNGQAIAGANASEVLVLADPADAGSSYQITVQVSNPAGIVTSPAVTMNVARRPSSGTETMIVASEGGVIETAAGASLVIPAGALLSDTTISVATQPGSTLSLPQGFEPMGEVLDIGPAGLTFAAPVTLALPVPDVLPADKVLALLEVASGAGVSGKRLAGKPSVDPVNVRRLATGKLLAGRRATSAPVNAAAVLCADAQSSRGGRFLVNLARAARYISAAVDESTCTSGASNPARRRIPSTTTTACLANEFVSDSLGDEVLMSRHVHCATNETELGWLQDERGNYGYFKLEWRIGSDGVAKGLNKQFRAKFRLTQLQPADVNGVNTPLRLSLRLRLPCTSQPFNGSCGGNVGTGSVTASPAWSSEIQLPVTFEWTGGDNTLNEFQFSDFELVYAMPTQTVEQNLADRRQIVSLRHPPAIRCDKGMAVNGGSGCVYAQAPAVLVFSAADPAVREAAEHIRDAQNAGSPGKLAFDSQNLWTTSGTVALQRTRVTGLKGTDTVDGANRRMSCTVADSVIRLRPKASDSCPADGVGCDCDEYPFNSTWNGSWLNKDGTSAKYINSDQNRQAGRWLQSFYQSERVLDTTPDPGIPFSPSNPSASIPARLGGDDFWVHIE